MKRNKNNKTSNNKQNNKFQHQQKTKAGILKRTHL